MKTWFLRIGTALAAAFLVLTLVNASWLAPKPTGAVKLIADRGIAPHPGRAAAGEETCAAARIEEPYNDYLGNTVAGALRAFKFGSPFVEVDVVPTSDGKIVLFGDAALDCRTDGSGAVRGKTLAELKALDIGYGYTADGGKSFPFRGKGVGAMPELGELLARLPRRARLMYHFTADDPAEADLLARTLAEAGRDPVASRDSFRGSAAPIGRIRERYPEAWAWTREEASACTRDYLLLGWSGYLPESCRGGTMLIPLDYQFPFWGWPNRLIERMEEHDGRIVMTGPGGGDRMSGIALPEQLGEVPDTFNGYLWVDDAFAVTPALHSRFDDRRQEEIDATTRAMQRRRAAQ